MDICGDSVIINESKNESVTVDHHPFEENGQHIESVYEPDGDKNSDDPDEGQKVTEFDAKEVNEGVDEEEFRTPAMSQRSDAEEVEDQKPDPRLENSCKEEDELPKNGCGDYEKKDDDAQSNELTEKRLKKKDMRNDWGISVGIYDVNGMVKRIVALDEVNNYIKLQFKEHYDFNYYLSLIDGRHPRFVRMNYNVQRWRMRYNVFADGVFSDPEPEQVMHVGEIHFYFDIDSNRSSKPFRAFLADFTVYFNEIPTDPRIDNELRKSMEEQWRKLSKDLSHAMLQLKFPLGSHMFHNKDDLFNKFIDRQHILMDTIAQFNHWKWSTNGHNNGNGNASRGKRRVFNGRRNRNSSENSIPPQHDRPGSGGSFRLSDGIVSYRGFKNSRSQSMNGSINDYRVDNGSLPPRARDRGPSFGNGPMIKGENRSFSRGNGHGRGRNRPRDSSNWREEPEGHAFDDSRENGSFFNGNERGRGSGRRHGPFKMRMINNNQRRNYQSRSSMD